MPIEYSQYNVDDFLPKFGITCPDVAELQTGDLLFPRFRDDAGKPIHGRFSQMIESRLEQNPNLFQSLKIEAVLAAHKTDLLDVKKPYRSGLQSNDISALMAEVFSSPTKRIPIGNFDPKKALHITQKIYIQNSEVAFKNNNSMYSSKFNELAFKQIIEYDSESAETQGLEDIQDEILANPKIIKLIFDIMKADGLTVLIAEWFSGEVPKNLKQFYTDPLTKMLFEMLTAHDPRTNVFLGHVGLVIREKEGQNAIGNDGNVYIIEANITSYSHYRVAMHPYFVSAEVDQVKKYLNDNIGNESIDYELAAANVTGWLNRRTAMLEHVWHARPEATLDNGFKGDWQNAIINAAKAMHGRPYGFFDQPEMGDDDRMYCSEFIYNAFKRGVSDNAANLLKEKMTWDNVRLSLEKDGNTKMHGFIDDILSKKDRYTKVPTDPFFVFQPAILWNSPCLQSILEPGHNSYAPKV